MKIHQSILTLPQDQTTTSLSPATPKTASADKPLCSTSLVGLAAPLFAMLDNIKHKTLSEPAEELGSELIEALQSFSKQATEQGHSEESVLLGEYILAKSLDTAIENTRWGQEASWETKRLISTLPQAKSLSANFSRALSKMCQMPSLFIEILELIYVCLSLSNDLVVDEHQSSRRINQALYQVIQSERGEFEKSLSKKATPTKKRKGFRFNRTIFSLFLASTLLIVASLYIGFNFLLNESSQNLSQQLSTINHKPNNNT